MYFTLPSSQRGVSMYVRIMATDRCIYIYIWFFFDSYATWFTRCGGVMGSSGSIQLTLAPISTLVARSPVHQSLPSGWLHQGGLYSRVKRGTNSGGVDERRTLKVGHLPNKCPRRANTTREEETKWNATGVGQDNVPLRSMQKSSA